MDNVVQPLLDRYGHHPTVLAWDVVNEPERGIRVSPFTARGVRRSTMRALIAEVVGLVHLCTDQMATVGSASIHTLPLVRGLGLDFYQPHWYDRPGRRADFQRSVATLGLDRPVVLGEFPTRASARRPREVLDGARAAGYRGAFAWSVTATDPWSDPVRLHDDLRDWISAATPKACRDASGTMPA